MRFLLVPLRMVLLVPHVLIGLGIAFIAFPLSRTQATRNRINHWWSSWVLRLCGVRLRVSGQPLTADLVRTGMTPGSNGRLLLSNHISWIDIFSINAAMPCRFVAKAEIVHWPIIGGMLGHSGTLFIERGRRHAVARINEVVQGHLRAGESIGVFPEGTTTRGDRLLPFHSNLLAPALEVGCEVWPVGLSYRERGQFSDSAAFIGDMGLVTSLLKILLADQLEVEVAFLPALPVEAHASRHVLARSARAALSEYFGFSDLPERAEAAEDLAA
ncbi:MAG TPA: lysophospholipid acyltransferase family protein [Burkholderiaceae bacterium]|nr:lysophospholipid acyltransferase family protein [Burkholderiaceae bacterium]